MAEYLVRFGESMIDVCYNSTGSMQAIDAIMDDNGIDSYTHEFTPGQSVTVPDEVYNSKAVQVANERPFNSACQVESSEIDTMIAELLKEIEQIFGYYIKLNGQDADLSITIGKYYVVVNASFESDGTVKIISISDTSMLSADISDGYIYIPVNDNNTGEDRIGIVTIGVEEDDTITRTITITQKSDF